MGRIATIPLQRTMALAISRSQEKLAVTQQRLTTGKKAANFADLGTETVRNLSAHSLLTRQTAQATVAKRVSTTLQIYEGHMTALESSVSELRTSIMTAIGTGEAAGLQEEVIGAFSQMRITLNASEGGQPMFAGSQIDKTPFTPKSLSELVGLNASDAFQDDKVRHTARVAEGVDLEYGIGASDLGKDLFAAFKALAEGGPLGPNLTAAQKLALEGVLEQLDTGINSLQLVNAENGRRINRVDDLAKRGDERALLLSGVIESNEDADLGQVATDLAQQKTMLEASYSVFAQLSGMSLVSYIR